MFGLSTFAFFLVKHFFSPRNPLHSVNGTKPTKALIFWNLHKGLGVNGQNHTWPLEGYVGLKVLALVGLELSVLLMCINFFPLLLPFSLDVVLVRFGA